MECVARLALAEYEAYGNACGEGVPGICCIESRWIWSGLLIAALGVAVLMVSAVSQLSYRRRARSHLFSCDEEVEDGRDQAA